MQDINWAEAYFIIAMMVLIVLLCVVSVWIFFRTYRKEMREKEQRLLAKREKTGTSAKN